MDKRYAWNKGKTAKNNASIARVARQKLKNVVDKETLDDLYVKQNLPLSEIGERYGVTRYVIKRLCVEFGLQRMRHSITCKELHHLYIEQGLTTVEISKMVKCSDGFIGQRLDQCGFPRRQIKNLAQVEPDPEELRRLYWDEWMGYQQIAEHYGVDMTTIPYWFKKFNIPRRSAWESRRSKNWEEPDIEIVKHLYESEMMGTHSIAQMFETSHKTIATMLVEAGVTLRRSGYPNVSHYTANDGHKVKSGLELQVDNWLHENNIPHEYEPKLGQTNYAADFLVGDTYIEIWGLMNNEKYQGKQKKKLEVYKALNLDLISVYRKDFPHLKILHCLLQ